jgi:hypothetical protein
MSRRMLACAVAFITPSAPLLVTVCQVLCADHAAAAEGPAAVEHSCHESAPASGVTVTAVPHACGHAADALAGLDEWSAPGQNVAVPPAIVESTIWTAPPLPLELRGTPAPVEHSPPGGFPLTSQLRV